MEEEDEEIEEAEEDEEFEEEEVVETETGQSVVAVENNAQRSSVPDSTAGDPCF